jgi:hypothetical protein
MTDYKLVDGELFPLSPEEQAELDKQRSTPRVATAPWLNGPTVAQAFEEHINVKS